jgi:hypothetical protein
MRDIEQSIIRECSKPFTERSPPPISSAASNSRKGSHRSTSLESFMGFNSLFQTYFHFKSFVLCLLYISYLDYFHSELDQVRPPFPHHARTILEVLSYISRLFPQIHGREKIEKIRGKKETRSAQSHFRYTWHV